MPYTGGYFKSKEVIKKRLLAKSKRDTENIEKNAKIVIQVDTFGNVLDKKIHPDHVLDIIAVIGPGNYAGNGINAEKAVLSEIGIGPTRPYNDANPNGKWIQSRNSNFNLQHPLPLSLRNEILSTIKDLTEKNCGKESI